MQRSAFVVVSVVLLCFRPIFPFSSFLPFLFIGGFDSSALCRSRRELSNEYLLGKFGLKENEKGIEFKTDIDYYLYLYYSCIVFTVLEESGQAYFSYARIPGFPFLF